MMSRHTLFALCLLPVGLLMMAPAPGEVGGCGDQDQIAQPYSHCRERHELECYRKRARGELTEPEQATCLGAAESTCAPAMSWSCDRDPTVRDSVACLDALRQASNLFIPYDSIPECAAVCPRTMGGAPPPPDMPPPAMADGGTEVDGSTDPDAGGE